MTNIEALIQKDLITIPFFELKENKVTDGTPLSVSISYDIEKRTELEKYLIDFDAMIESQIYRASIDKLMHHFISNFAEAELTPQLKKYSIMNSRLASCLMETPDTIILESLRTEDHLIYPLINYKESSVFVWSGMPYSQSHVYTFDEGVQLEFDVETSITSNEGINTHHIQLNTKFLENFKPCIWNFPEKMLDNIDPMSFYEYHSIK